LDVIETFSQRGFVAQATDEAGLRDLFERETVTAYIGFDPTASSLHVGSLLPIMALAHLQRLGHRPLALLGGGTGLVGDPSGKTEARQLLARKKLEANVAGIREQLAHYLDFEGGRALMLNNADWLVSLNYIDFLRQVGRHVSVNRMMTYESVKLRLNSEAGLSFLEFNYLILQAYDFYHLSTHHDCRLQMGGTDQWGNITAGIDLTRRLGGKQLFGLVFPLISAAGGQKMGKTHAGAVWLDQNLTSPYDYYQYWINTDDADVGRFLAYFTFLPLEEIRELGGLKGAEVNRAKKVLAYEATTLAHGRSAADSARAASESAFKGRGKADDLPTVLISRDDYENKCAFQLFTEAGLCPSGSEARRLIDQGGAYVGETKVRAFDQPIKELLDPKGALIRAGKKRYKRVVVAD